MMSADRWIQSGIIYVCAFLLLAAVFQNVSAKKNKKDPVKLPTKNGGHQDFYQRQGIKMPDLSEIDFSKIPGAEVKNMTFEKPKPVYDYDSDPSPSFLTKLTADNFTSFIESNTHVLVYFYAPWCEQCKLVYPKYKNTAETLSIKEAKTKLAVLNGDTDGDVMKKYQLDVYPSALYFTEGDLDLPETLTGGIGQEYFLDWILRREQPLVPDVTGQNLQRFMDKEDITAGNVMIIGFVLNGSNKEKFFKQFARESYDFLERKFAIYYVQTKSSVRIELHHMKQIFELEDDDEVQTYYGNDDRIWDEDELNALIDKFYLRTVHQEFNPRLHILPNAVLGFIVTAKERRTQWLAEMFEPIAKDYANSINFTLLAPDEQFDLAVKLGVNAQNQSFFLAEFNEAKGRVFGKKGPKKYKYEGELTAEKVSEFLKEWKEGELSAYVKDVGEIPNNVTLTHITAKTFAQIALNPEKVVFVMYATPWCEECKHLIENWVHLDNEMKRSPKYKDISVVAIMNAAANDVKDTQVTSYPSFVLYPMGENSMKHRRPYDGPNTKESFIAFMEDALDDALEGEL